jgi:hypothetical protein
VQLPNMLYDLRTSVSYEQKLPVPDGLPSGASCSQVVTHNVRALHRLRVSSAEAALLVRRQRRDQ